MRWLSARTSFAVLLVAAASVAQEPPPWAKRDFDAPANQVYAAALKSIQLQKHEVQTKNEQIYTVEFHVGTTVSSWGYNMRLVVTTIDGSHSRVTIGVLKSGGKVFSWGSGKKEVRKIFSGIDAELISARANPQPRAPTAQSEETRPTSGVDVSSEPSAADVELDGKFVGTTPTTLRLRPGEYIITIKKAGFAPWTRTLHVIPDNELKIRAELVRTQ